MMKLKVRFGKRSERFEVSESDSANLLKEQVAAKFGIPTANFDLSLNGKDVIALEESSLISDLELVSGDLLKVILTNEPNVNLDTSVKRNDSRIASSHTNSSQEQHNMRAVPHGTDGASNNNSLPGSGTSCSSLLSTTDQKRDNGNDGSSEATLMDTSADAGMARSSCQGAAENFDDSPQRADSSMMLNEPMVVRGCSGDNLPHRLRQAWDANKPGGITEALSLVLHVMMLETGFLPHVHTKVDTDDVISQTVVTSAECLPGGWNQFGSCRFSCLHQLYDQTQVCHLACVSLGSLLTVTGLISHKTNSSFSCQLKPSEFIIKEGKERTAKLSMLFKDSVAHPMTHQLRKNCGILTHDGMLALPVDVQIHILRYLDLKSLLKLSEVCQRLLGLSQADTLWRCLCLRDLRITANVRSNNCLWKEVYKKHYKEVKDRERAEEERRREAMQRLRHPHFVPPGFPGGYPGAHLPGFRGGDYDLDPFGHPFQPQGNPLHRGQLQPRRDPIFPADPNLDPMRGGAGRGLRDNSMGLGLGFRHGRSGGPSGSFGGMGFL